MACAQRQRRAAPRGRLLVLALLLPCAAAQAQAPPPSPSPSPGAIQGVEVQQLANALLGIMICMVARDVTTGSLSIDKGSSANAGLFLTQLGGGLTWSRELPAYLEGHAVCARFDPVFIVSDSAEDRLAPTQWNSLALTGGIGWHFGLSKHGLVRPIFNFTPALAGSIHHPRSKSRPANP